MRRAILASFTLLAALACSTGATSPEEQEALEQAFEESMRGAVLVGKFTIFGEAGQSQAAEGEGREIRLRSEKYEIEKVVKRTGDLWTFHARIQFGDKDVTVPVPVKLSWAGDTPVVGVTDLGIPGLGTYTARVVFYQDSYAGMWWGATHGGNMFGTIERPEEDQPSGE